VPNISPKSCLKNLNRLGFPVTSCWSRLRELGIFLLRLTWRTVRPLSAYRPRGACSAKFFVCSSCSCSPLFSIWFCFRFSLQLVCGRSELQKRTVRIPRGRSAWSSRTVRFYRFVSGGSVGFNGLSVAPGQTVRVALADYLRHLTGQSASAWQLCSLARFLPSFFRAYACASRNRS
jgi:hypothetical protein